MTELTSKQLRKAAGIKDKIEALQADLDRLLSGVDNGSAVKSVAPKKRTMSAEGRARIAAAQKARWAKFNSKKK